jgi:hypothetical protein
LTDFLDLAFPVIDQVDHLAVERRQLRQASLQDAASFRAYPSTSWEYPRCLR